MSKEARMIDNTYHWKFGRHSGIPDCCVEYWLTQWDNDRNTQSKHHEAVICLGWGYVPCPACLSLKRKARVVQCDLECGGQHLKDFETLEETI